MKKEVINKYFNAWVKKDISMIENLFSEDCVYSECFGEEYHGEKQILRWFSDWNRSGSILEWSAKRVFEFENTMIVESFFKCFVEKEFACDAVSVFRFNDDGKICEVREYWSKLEHHCPYGETK